MLAECVVVGKSVFSHPAAVAIRAFIEFVEVLRLTDFGTTRIEVLVVVVGEVVSEAAHKLQARKDVTDLERSSRPNIACAVVAVFGSKQAHGVNGVAVDVGVVAAIFSYVFRIFGSYAVIVAVSVVNGSRAWHHDSADNSAGVTAVGVLRAALGVDPRECFVDCNPLVELEFAVVVKSGLAVPGVDKHTVVAVVSKRNAVFGVFCTCVKSHIVTVIERVAEYFVHPVGASGGNPRVLVGVPTVGECKSGISVRNLTHFYLLLSVQALRQVACRAHAHYAVVAD